MVSEMRTSTQRCVRVCITPFCGEGQTRRTPASETHFISKKSEFGLKQKKELTRAP